MSFDVDWVRAGTQSCVERERDVPWDGPFGAALSLVENVAKRHDGEIRLQSGGDDGSVVEFRFRIPDPSA